MRFTTSKDCDKVNKILPVLKEHFGNSINLARLKFMSLILHALVIAQTVSLLKLDSFKPTEVGRDSNIRRIQRFIRLFGKDCIDCLVADLEFVGKQRVADYQTLICFDRPEQRIETYRKRWQIETLFKGLKSSGFDIEKTHLHDTERIARILALVCMAFTWAYLVGIHKDIYVKPLRILKHGYAVKSLVKYGLEEIADVLARHLRTPNFDVFKFLSCS